jgi:putative membrane protein
MFIGISVMLLFWGIIITLVFFAVRSLIRSSESSGPRVVHPTERQTPLEILQERYARGEINRQEYKEMRGDLEN